MMNNDAPNRSFKENQQVFDALRRAKSVIDRSSPEFSLKQNVTQSLMPQFSNNAGNTRNALKEARVKDEARSIAKIKELNESLTLVLQEKEELLTDALGLVDENEDLVFQLEEKTRECGKLRDENQTLKSQLSECRADLERMSQIEESKADVWKMSDYEMAVGAINKGMQRKIRAIEEEKRTMEILMRKYQEEAQAAQEAAFDAVQENKLYKKISSGCLSCRTKHQESQSKVSDMLNDALGLSPKEIKPNSVLCLLTGGRFDSNPSDNKTEQTNKSIHRSVSGLERGILTMPMLKKSLSESQTLARDSTPSKTRSSPRAIDTVKSRSSLFSSTISESSEPEVPQRPPRRPSANTPLEKKVSDRLDQDCSQDSVTTASSLSLSSSQPGSRRLARSSTERDVNYIESFDPFDSSKNCHAKISEEEAFSSDPTDDVWFAQLRKKNFDDHTKDENDYDATSIRGPQQGTRRAERRASSSSYVIGVPFKMSRRLSRSRFGQSRAGKMFLSRDQTKGKSQ